MLRTLPIFALFALMPLIALAQPPDDLVERVTQATAFVKRTPAGEGTAFCIDPAGLFITNLHVVDGVDLLATVPLVLDSGTPTARTVLARNLSSSREWDLALLKVDGEESLPFLPLRDADEEPALGDGVRAFGFPFGTLVDGRNPSITMNQGRVSSLGRDDTGTLNHVRFDAVVNFGNSGGPLVDEQGRVVGVVTAKMAPPADRTSFAVSLPRMREFLRQPGLGMRVDPILWEERGEPAEFHIGLVNDFGSERFRPVKPDRIELDLSADSGETWQTTTAVVDDDTKDVTIMAVPDPRQELKLLVRLGQGPQVNPGELVPLSDRVIYEKVQGKLSDATRLINIPGDKVQIELRKGGNPSVPVADLIDAEQYLSEGTWNASVVHIDDPHVGFIQARVRALAADSLLITTVQLAFPLAERPLYAGFPGDPMRLDREGPVDSVSVQLGLEGQAMIALGDVWQVPVMPEAAGPADDAEPDRPEQPPFRDITGLLLQFPGGQKPPGEHSLAGPFVRVNLRLWHFATPATNAHPPNVLPIELAEGEWECQVFRDFAAGTKEKEQLPGEVSIKRVDQGIVVNLSTPGGKRASYRLMFRPKAQPATSP